jgi:hypothetical protein
MYNYEIRFRNIPAGQSEYLENQFLQYIHGASFAAVEWAIERNSNDRITFKFSSRKVFDPDCEDGINDNLIPVLLGKEQFFSNIWYQFLYDDFNQLEIDRMKTVFVADDGSEWTVDYSKYCSLTSIPCCPCRNFDGMENLKSFAEYIQNRGNSLNN